MARKLSLISLTLVGALNAAQAAVVPPADPSQSLSPAVQTAVKELSSDSFTDRTKGLHDLQAAFTQQAVALAMENDKEVQASLLEALEFDDELIRWVEALMKLPATERDEQLRIVSHPEAVQVLAKAFSSQLVLRTQGIAELAKLDMPGVDGLLGRMIDDDNRPVAVAAMDAVWDRKPAEPTVDALWRRAVDDGAGRQKHEPSPIRSVISFRGHPIPGAFFTDSGWQRGMDNEIATDVLIHLQSPLVKEKVIAYFNRAGKVAMNPDASDGQLEEYDVSRWTARNGYLLLESYKPAEAVPSLYALATCRAARKSVYGSRGAKHIMNTNRTAALANLAALTGQNLKDYELRLLDQGEAGKQWVCDGDDDDAVVKMREWWEQNGARYLAKPAADAKPITAEAAP